MILWVNSSRACFMSSGLSEFTTIGSIPADSQKLGSKKLLLVMVKNPVCWWLGSLKAQLGRLAHTP